MHIADPSQKKTRLVISSGEPAGIGPDICLSLSKPSLSDRGLIDQGLIEQGLIEKGLPTFDNTELYIVADPELLEQRAHLLNTDISLHIHHNTEKLSDFYQPEKLNIIPLTLNSPCQSGMLNPDNSRYVLDILDLCHQLCMNKNVDAMVTGPVQKSIINQAGFNFTGHTEYLADKTAATPVMMLATKTMRVALATTHLPVKDISAAITRASLTETIEILNRFLKQQAGINEPHILICGLNPHAGENGNLGDEEINVITPIIKELQQKGLNLTGPLPADTLFTPKYLDNADAVLAMYHDQGLPVLKYSGFGKAVNITLGLPFVRTSVDHGTALDLAGTGEASNSSMIEAIKAAVEYCGLRPMNNE